MSTVKQKRVDLENAYRNNLSEITTCKNSIAAIDNGEKQTHPKDYYVNRIGLLENENEHLEHQLSTGAYLKEEAPAGAASVNVDLSPVVSAVNDGFSKVEAALKGMLPKTQ